MGTLTLVIGNRNYSSWSLRPWLVMKMAGISFEEKLIRLDHEPSRPDLLAISPSAKVPVLLHGNRVIWDSLAIMEYLAELAPGANLWPADDAKRAAARAVSAEMHSGFGALRTHMPVNIRRSAPGLGRKPGVEGDIERIMAIWRQCRADHGNGGDFLFGDWSMADAMYAPVVTRFVTYGVEVDEVCRAYMNATLALPAMAEWCQAAADEPWTISIGEVSE